MTCPFLERESREETGPALKESAGAGWSNGGHSRSLTEKCLPGMEPGSLDTTLCTRVYIDCWTPFVADMVLLSAAVFDTRLSKTF